MSIDRIIRDVLDEFLAEKIADCSICGATITRTANALGVGCLLCAIRGLLGEPESEPELDLPPPPPPVSERIAERPGRAERLAAPVRRTAVPVRRS